VRRADCTHIALVASVGDIAQSVELGTAPEELEWREELHKVAAEEATEEPEHLVAILVVLLVLEQEAVAIVAELDYRAAGTVAVEAGTEADPEDNLSTLVVEYLVDRSVLLGGMESLEEDIDIPLEAGLRQSMLAGVVDERIDSGRRGFLRVDSTVTLLNCFELCYSFLSFELNSDIASFEARLGREKCKVRW
jgi:hypothetical protein